MNTSIETWVSHLTESILSNSFIKITLGNYKGIEVDLKNMYVKQVVIKKQPKFNVVYRYKTKDITKNYTKYEITTLLNEMVVESGFRYGCIYTSSKDWIIELNAKNIWQIKSQNPTTTEKPNLEHDNTKQRKITSENKPYLYALQITDKDGNVLKSGYDKYRQINHYIEILSSLLKELPEREVIKVADMGAGKGYLTFALYDYLTQTLNRNAEVKGIEYRKDLVVLCNNIAKDSNMEGLSFEQNTIQEFDDKKIHILIALHACDTATDDAIQKGINANADLIVVAPCCHKQIRREMEKSNKSNEIDSITKHGIFLERQAEMVTDSLRSLILEANGYDTKVIEFISDAHTHKNILIIGSKSKTDKKNKAEILTKIETTKKYFGIEKYYLEEVL
jgi:hypothetical protein